MSRQQRSSYYPPVSSRNPATNLRYSSRSSYPVFLSLQDTAWFQLTCAGRGLVDAFRWDTVVRLVASDPEVRSNVFKSLLLNLVSLTSIYFLDLLLLPLAQSQQKWLHRNVGWFYQVLWLLPVVGASLYLNSSWCTLLAKRTFTLQHGTRAVAQQPSTYSGMLNSLATSAYRIVMVFTSVVVSFALGYIPLVGPLLGFAFFCWVDAYYCFEFIWIARGLSLSRRLRHLEERWAYYFAFGLPSAALCMWGSSLANAALFALFFPAFIIMAIYARPVPLDPYNPVMSKSQDGGLDEESQFPSPLVPIRLPIFAVVIWLNDWIVRALSVGGGRGGSGNRKSDNNLSARHRRVLSDSAESIEEGGAIQLNAFTAGMASGRARVRVGGESGIFDPRRKLD